MKKLISFIIILFVSITTFGQTTTSCIEGPSDVCYGVDYEYKDSCITTFNWHIVPESAALINPYGNICRVISIDPFLQDFKLYSNDDNWKLINVMEIPTRPTFISGCGVGVHDTVYKNNICHYFLTSDTSDNNHTWEVNGGTIIGNIHENNIYVTWTEIGDHNYVRVSDTNSNGCSSSNIKIVHIIPPISIDDIKNQSLKIYPNPATDVININFDNKIDYIEICNINGQKIFETKINTNKLSINISEYSNGIYIIKMKNDKISYFEKFLKN